MVGLGMIAGNMAVVDGNERFAQRKVPLSHILASNK